MKVLCGDFLPTDRHETKEISRLIDQEGDRQTVRQTDRQRGRTTDREADR